MIDLPYEPLPIKSSATEPLRSDEQYQVFIARVVRVDYERKVVAIRDSRNGVVYDEVNAIPANSSSSSATDVDMPEEGSACLAVALEWNRGSSQHVILNYVTSDTTTGQDAVAQRAITDAPSHMPVWTERQRGVYRKAYPGQHTIVKTGGFTSKTDTAWDQTAMDMSRDQLDPFRRTHLSSTGRTVDRTDYALKFEGFVHRPDADASDITPHTLPDGSKEWVLYLNGSETDWKTRYLSGKEDMLPFVEHVEKIQEFGLDFPVPHEVFETDMWDNLLGLTRPDPEWWQRTATKTKNTTVPTECDDQSFLIEQNWDHPFDPQKNPGVGPTTKEGKTPRRRGWIIEKSEGTVVGSNMFDKATYGKVLKPTIFPLTREGRFGSDTESSYVPINKTTDQVEAKMAAGAWSLRFPYEYNTTRFDVTKEGMVLFEVGSSIPKENIVWDGGTYEHPHGAGRSLEGHFAGSVKMVIGKNRDEEESLDIQTIGGTVLRLGADDASTPNARRQTHTQIRGKKDMVTDRTIQWWDRDGVKLVPGDAGTLGVGKSGAENVSLRAALDGGMVLRLGAREESVKRRHLINGYEDPQGVKRYTIEDAERKDARSAGRPTYDKPGDETYRFHNLAEVGKPLLGEPPRSGIFPYKWSGTPADPEKLGLSADIHAVRDILLRVGTNNGVSASLDLAGALLAAIGKDKFGRSLVAALDGGIEMTVGKNSQDKGVRLEIDGDVDIVIKGNLHLNVTGDTTFETNRNLTIAKLSDITRSMKIQTFAQVLHTSEAPNIVNNQGAYVSGA